VTSESIAVTVCLSL